MLRSSLRFGLAIALCIASAARAGMPPICDGTMSTCRQCSANDDGQPDGCTGTKPTCETNEESPKFGDCVECTSNADCSNQTPVCIAEGPSADSCRGCTSDADCSSSATGTLCLPGGACGMAAGSSCASTAAPGGVAALALLMTLAVRRKRKLFRAL